MLNKFEDVELIELPEQGIVMKRIVSRELHGESISISWVQITGRHRRMRSDRSQRVYYVIEGTADFRVGDGPVFPIGPRDSVVIPAGIPYDFTGDLEYLVINTPAYVKGDDIDVK